jgi:hypothetical protein
MNAVMRNFPDGPDVRPARGGSCPLAGRSLRPSRPPLTALRLRSAILAALASTARSRARPTPRFPVLVMNVEWSPVVRDFP